MKQVSLLDIRPAASELCCAGDGLDHQTVKSLPAPAAGIVLNNLESREHCSFGC